MITLACLPAGQLTHAFPFEERVLAQVRELHNLAAPGVVLPNLELKDRSFQLSTNPVKRPGLATLIFKQGNVEFWPDNGSLFTLSLPKQAGPTVPQSEIERRARIILDQFLAEGDLQEFSEGKFDHIAETYTLSCGVVRKGFLLKSNWIVLHSQTAQLLKLRIPRRFFDLSLPVVPKITATEAFEIAARTYLAHRPYGLTDYQATVRPAWSEVVHRPRRAPNPRLAVAWEARVPKERIGRTTLTSVTRFGQQLCYVDWVTGQPDRLFDMTLDLGLSQAKKEADTDVENRSWTLFGSGVSGSLQTSNPPKVMGSTTPQPRLGRRVLLFSEPYVMSGAYNATSDRFEVEFSRERKFFLPSPTLRQALLRTVR